MNFTNNTEKLLIKRSIFLFIVVLSVSLVLFKFNMQLLFGLVIGYAVGLIRFRSLCEMGKCMLSSTCINPRPIVIKYFIVQLLTITVLFACAVKSMMVFFSVAVGMGTITLVIMFNAFTETVGLTSNNFE